ncbi:MAG TPA: HAD family hydrolase [Micromonosporaceae bacterium]|jgi:HAD superfamily hydrolase (TIGR01549 family)
MPRPRAITAAVFDLDGTLVDSMRAAPAAYADTIRCRGGPTLGVSDVIAAWHLGPAPVVLAHFLGRPTTAEDMAEYYRRLDLRSVDVEPFPGVRDMLRSLRSSGYRIGVYTSATRRAAWLLLARAGLDDAFAVVVGGDDVNSPKPAPHGLHMACHGMGVTAEQTAYVGDADVDLQCARAAGSLGIHARWASPGGSTGRDLVADRPEDVVCLLGQASDLERR